MDDENKGVPSPEGEGASEVHDSAADTVDSPSTSVSVVPPVPPPTPPVPAGAVEAEDDDDPEEQGMLRMSFMEHLEELRSRIIKALYGLGVAFVLSLVYAGNLWDIISEPAISALTHLHVVPPKLAALTPMESFSVIWVKLPLLCSVFLASPWVVYQVWAFISPGLYKKERRWALPFVLLTAGLFISGGLFAYFLAFRYGLEFLLGIGMSNNVQPVVSITEYFDLFVNVTLGVGLVFELPVLIFLLTLLRILSPRFLLRHSRYAILIIVIAAAIITPTPDVFNLMMFAIPMALLYFVGIFFSYQLVLRREGKKFPWGIAVLILTGILLVVIVSYFAILHYHLHFTKHWPFLSS